MHQFNAVNASPIEAFKINGKDYLHMLHLSNDSVYLINGDGEILLEFTSNSYIYDVTVNPRRQLGHFRLTNNHWWLVNDVLGTETIGSSFNTPEGLLNDEIVFSKHWLTNQDKYAGTKMR